MGSQIKNPTPAGPTNSTLQTASLLGLDTAPKRQFLFVFPRARRSPVSRSHTTHFSPWRAARVRRLPQSSATPRRRRLARPPQLPGGGDSPGPRDSPVARTCLAPATSRRRGLAWPRGFPPAWTPQRLRFLSQSAPTRRGRDAS